MIVGGAAIGFGIGTVAYGGAVASFAIDKSLILTEMAVTSGTALQTKLGKVGAEVIIKGGEFAYKGVRALVNLGYTHSNFVKDAGDMVSGFVPSPVENKYQFYGFLFKEFIDRSKK